MDIEPPSSRRARVLRGCLLSGPVIGVWAVVPPYLGPKLNATSRVEVADHVVPSIVVLVATLVTVLGLRREQGVRRRLCLRPRRPPGRHVDGGDPPRSGAPSSPPRWPLGGRGLPRPPRPGRRRSRVALVGDGLVDLVRRVTHVTGPQSVRRTAAPRCTGTTDELCPGLHSPVPDRRASVPAGVLPLTYIASVAEKEASAQ